MSTLDSLMTSGITFDNVWSNPTCSPSRAAIMTGKHGFRNGVLEPGDQLASEEGSLFRMLDQTSSGEYTSSLIGKWHLGGTPNRNADYPSEFGIDFYSGIIGGGVGDYFDWPLTTNSQTTDQTGYTTSVLTDIASDWISQQNAPWFSWLAYNAPHTPFHLPPADLHSRNLSGTETDITNNPLPYYLAALESLDKELGRLLREMPEDVRQNTVFILVGDNGTPGQVAQSPFGRMSAKGSLNEGGINVPMVISGAGVSRQGEREDAMISFTDLFATILEISGTAMPLVNDSRSFEFLLRDMTGPQRSCNYSDSNNGWVARDSQFKYFNSTDGSEEFYDLLADPFEATNLINRTLTDVQETSLNKLRDPFADRSSCLSALQTSVEETPIQHSYLSLYPNPSDGVVFVENSGAEPKDFRLVDIQGRQIEEGVLGVGRNVISTEDLPPGRYILVTAEESFRLITR